MKRKTSIGISIALICVIIVGCGIFALFKYSSNVEDYFAVCVDNGFKMYMQEVSSDSTSGVIKSYTSTLQEKNIQMDYYTFESKSHAFQALERLKAWVQESYGDGGKSYSRFVKSYWVYDTDDIYCKAVIVDNTLVYVVCTNNEYVKQAIKILSRAT